MFGFVHPWAGEPTGKLQPAEGAIFMNRDLQHRVLTSEMDI